MQLIPRQTVHIVYAKISSVDPHTGVDIFSQVLPWKELLVEEVCGAKEVTAHRKKILQSLRKLLFLVVGVLGRQANVLRHVFKSQRDSKHVEEFVITLSQ